MMRIWMCLAAVCAAQALAQPVIDDGGVVNATGYQTILAPDTVFVIFGSSLGPATLTAASAPNYPTSLGGTSITFTSSSGASITARMVYSSAGQVAGLLPSSIAPGTYAVSVTFNSQTSAPQTVTVVSRSFGIATANSAGTGPAQATIGNVNSGVSLVRFTGGTLAFGGFDWTLTPAHPGDTLVLWGTGGGADPANDTGGTSGDQTAAGNFSVTVEGTSITPLYAGASSGYPGLWQINFTLPSNIATDCFASLQVSAGGQLSNQVTIAIAPVGQDTCSAPGFSAPSIVQLASGGNVTDAILSIGTTTTIVGGTTTVTEAVNAAFENDSASAFLPPFEGPVVGPCRILEETYPAVGLAPTAPTSYLDAGSMTISGPGISSQTVAAIPNSPPGPTGTYYSSQFPAGTIVNGGNYTLTGSGGGGIAAFSVTQTVPPAFTVSNFSSLATIDRSQPTTVNWTGGGSGSVVITIDALHFDSTLTTAYQTFVACTVPTIAGTFTIPAAALSYLPAVTPGGYDVASLNIEATQAIIGVVTGVSTAVQQFTPNLTSGGVVDFGWFAAFIAFDQNIAIQ